MRFEEAITFVSFVQVQPKKAAHEELLYKVMNEKLGLSREVFDSIKTVYSEKIVSMSKEDILDYKEIFNDFEQTKDDTYARFKSGALSERNQTLNLLLACQELENRVNQKVVEPITLKVKQEILTQPKEQQVETKIGKVREDKASSKIGKFFSTLIKK